jgi:ATP-dependent 26S proteasome regulatory subunit
LSGSFNIAGDASLTSVARRGEGLTGAWLREVLITAELNALQDGSDVIRDFDLERALNDVNDRRAICREPTEISMPNCSDMSELYA